MSNDKAELTRISNFIEKEVAVEDLEDIYESMYHLEEVMEKAKKGMDKLKSYLEREGIRPEHYSPDMGKKIVFQEGKKKTEIDIEGLASELPFNKLLKVVKVNESDLKKNIEGGEVLASKYKREVGKSKDSILVKDMTKKELKEYQQ